MDINGSDVDVPAQLLQKVFCRNEKNREARDISTSTIKPAQLIQ